ncbi:hypothetical protein [Flavobacterium hydatis]|uniref:Uncharacterized protein n=2 Tax=Flavobacterium hydatis TaxID=991 RepID=A0A086ATE6_FLAHY|nr:hypothetical protein [Flavobacterium hydatis]KFF19960.1 hypothetical protein IW20_02190 [Flavobacterium hydatis]OXA91475.1 hypothetical protein B0A62_17515 [Flavobacterium hydatis]
MMYDTEKESKKFKKILINEGWYKDKQLKTGQLRELDFNLKARANPESLQNMTLYQGIVGTRDLYNTYDQIPLNLMFHFSKDSKVVYDEKIIELKHTIKDEFIQTVKKSLDRYINACNNLPNSYVVGYNDPLSNRDLIDIEYLEKLQKISYLDYIDIEILKKLRNKYLHWSVKANELGLGSRESQAPSKDGAFEGKYRKREIHNG